MSTTLTVEHIDVPEAAQHVCPLKPRTRRYLSTSGELVDVTTTRLDTSHAFANERFYPDTIAGWTFVDIPKG